MQAKISWRRGIAKARLGIARVADGRDAVLFDLLHHGVNHLANAEACEIVVLNAPAQDVGKRLPLFHVDELLDEAQVAANRADEDSRRR